MGTVVGINDSGGVMAEEEEEAEEEVENEAVDRQFFNVGMEIGLVVSLFFVFFR
jgi:hypothetical protein